MRVDFTFSASRSSTRNAKQFSINIHEFYKILKESNVVNINNNSDCYIEFAGTTFMKKRRIHLLGKNAAIRSTDLINIYRGG